MFVKIIGGYRQRKVSNKTENSEIWVKNALCEYYWATILKTIVILKSTLPNYSKSKVSCSNKKLRFEIKNALL